MKFNRYKLISLVCLVMFFISCQPKEKKYCYFQDYRSFVHKQSYVSIEKHKASKLNDMYMNLGESSFIDFANECGKIGTSSIRAKKMGEIIRYYPELGIAKVLFRFSNEELNAPARMDVRKRKYYVPIMLLHDTVPEVDTVKYIPDAYDW